MYINLCVCGCKVFEPLKHMFRKFTIPHPKYQRKISQNYNKNHTSILPSSVPWIVLILNM
jgi:hypothetical protein